MSTTWNPLRTVAEFSQRGWRVELDPVKPSSPLTFVPNTGVRWEALAIQPLPKHSLKAEEIYVRQQDLIARFSQVGEDSYGFQLEWRLIDAPSGFDVGIEVWISIQTSLLDTAPMIQVSSQGIGDWVGWQHHQLATNSPPSAEADQGWSSSNRNTLAALKCTDAHNSCLWLVEPRDLQQIHWTNPLAAKDQHAQLFGEFLEKGVIRRARMQLLVSNHSIGLAEVQGAYQQLIQRELPLTA